MVLFAGSGVRWRLTIAIHGSDLAVVQLQEECCQ